MRVTGVDGWKGKWVAVTLESGMLADIQVYSSLESLAKSDLQTRVIGLDMPIGLTNSPPRKADQLARSAIGPRRSSVFDPPPRFCLAAKWTDYQQANKEAKQLCGRGISAQGFALLALIREAESAAKQDDRFYEVHPELSFYRMKEAVPLEFSKKTWNGFHERRRLLARQGIEFEDLLSPELGKIPPDDLLDAAAVAWSASRIALETAESFPQQGSRKRGKIWF